MLSSRALSTVLSPILVIIALPAIVVSAPFAPEHEIGLNAAGERVVRVHGPAVGTGEDSPDRGEAILPPVPVAPAGGPLADTLWIDRNHSAAVPSQVAISGQGNFIIAGWWLNNERASCYLVEDDNVPEWTQPLASLEEIPVGISFDATRVLSADPDSIHLRDSGGAVGFEKPFPPFYDGLFAAVGDSGTMIVVCSTRLDTTRLSGLDPATGDSLWSIDFLPGSFTGPVVGIDVSSDESVVALTTNTSVEMVDGATGSLINTISVPWVPGVPAALSADGSLVAVGGYSPFVRLYERDGSTYTLRWERNTNATYVTAVDVSDDGSTVAAGTFINLVPPKGSLLVWDANNPVPLWVRTNFGDLVSSVALSLTGDLGIAGCWGRQGGSFGIILCIFSRTPGAPLLYSLADDRVTGVASIVDVAMADSGDYFAAGAKAVHARELGNGGAIIAGFAPGDVITGVHGETFPATIGSPILLESRPNPFVSSGHIAFRVPGEGSPVTLDLYDAQGRKVRRLLNRSWSQGDREVPWDGRDAEGNPLAPGIYLYRLVGDDFSATNKLILTR